MRFVSWLRSCQLPFDGMSPGMTPDPVVVSRSKSGCLRFRNGKTMPGKMTLLSSLLVLVSLPLSAAAPPAKEKAKSAQSIAELQQGLEKILADTHTPGVSVAIVHRDGPEWVA